MAWTRTVTTTGLRFTGEGAGNRAGQAVAFVGNVTGDGRSEFAFTSNGTALAGDTRDNGAIYIIQTPPDEGGPAVERAHAVLWGDTYGDAGFSVAGAGDVDGNGWDEVLVGVYLEVCPAGGEVMGGVYLLSGYDFGGRALEGSELREYTAHGTGYYAGHRVSGAGDLDDDRLQRRRRPGAPEPGHRRGGHRL